MKFYDLFLMIIPFFGFLLGYWLLFHYFSWDIIEVPNVIGCPIHEAVGLLSAQSLNIRILKEQENNDLPSGIIVNQIPEKGQKIKKHQSIFLVLSKKNIPKAPPLCGKKRDEVVALCKDAHISLKLFMVPSHSPEGQCVAQIPKAGHALADHSIIAYISEGNDKLVILPDFSGRSVKDVCEFLQTYNIPVQISHQEEVSASHNCMHCMVEAQRPLPRSLIDLKKMVRIQLQACVRKD